MKERVCRTTYCGEHKDRSFIAGERTITLNVNKYVLYLANRIK